MHLQDTAGDLIPHAWRDPLPATTLHMTAQSRNEMRYTKRKLVNLDYVTEACACQGYDEKGKPYVKLVVAPADPEADQDELREKIMTYCKENFESISWPRKILFVEALPRTKMEKIDFVALSDKLPTA